MKALRALVAYESMFGNTELVARSVASGLARSMEVELFEVNAAPAVPADVIDVMVLGGPTHALSMTRRETREEAVTKGATHGTTEVGIREWLAQLPAGPLSAVVATFDTRIAKVRRLPGSAAKKAAKVMHTLGYVSDTKPRASSSRTPMARCWTGSWTAHLPGGNASAPEHAPAPGSVGPVWVASKPGTFDPVESPQRRAAWETRRRRQVLIKDVMSSPAITITARMSVKDGLKLLDEHRVTSLPVTDQDGHILGIVSESDLLRDAVHPDPRAHMFLDEQWQEPPHRVEDVMSTLSMTVSSDADLSDAVELMTSTAVKSLPVVDDGRVVGVVSRSDVVHLLARSDDRIQGEIDDLLRSAGLDCEVEVEGGIVTLRNLDDAAQWRVAQVIAGSVAGVMSVHTPG
ncbi:MAG TPA: CBS domain-containing protein [Nocardioidaceae bacterium]|nr:CBS domain-containing protein [Nocardioidaceae bacterium]